MRGRLGATKGARGRPKRPVVTEVASRFGAGLCGAVVVCTVLSCSPEGGLAGGETRAAQVYASAIDTLIARSGRTSIGVFPRVAGSVGDGASEIVFRGESEEDFVDIGVEDLTRGIALANRRAVRCLPSLPVVGNCSSAEGETVQAVVLFSDVRDLGSGGSYVLVAVLTRDSGHTSIGDMRIEVVDTGDGALGVSRIVSRGEESYW